MRSKIYEKCEKMSVDVFNRYEKKYLLNDAEHEALLEKVKPYMELDEYNKKREYYTISNIYYDTENDDLIRHSITKPIYKEKVRIRSYGVPQVEDEVFVEIKKKYKGMVNKRRTTMKLNHAYVYLDNGKWPDMDMNYGNSQVLREVDTILERYKLFPKLYLAYDRQAFFSKDDRSFRLTFDKNIRTRRHAVQLEAGDMGEGLLPNGVWLMEVKISNAMPLWFSKILSELNIYPISFSKYGTEYKNYIGEKKICLKPF